jgi:hypothetical protein
MAIKKAGPDTSGEGPDYSDYIEVPPEHNQSTFTRSTAEITLDALKFSK